MTGSRPQGQATAEGAHLVLYDGVCGLCNGLVHFLLDHDRRILFTFASLQSAAGKRTVERFGGNPNELTSFFVVADYRTNRAQLFSRSRAVLFVAGGLGWPWRAALIFRVVPTAILDRGYDVVAKHRYRVFGRYEQCLIPRPEVRGRFID